MLSGLIVCGRCGYRMRIAYQPNERKKARDWCNTRLNDGREESCFGLTVRYWWTNWLPNRFSVLEPAAVELSLQAATDIQR